MANIHYISYAVGQVINDDRLGEIEVKKISGAHCHGCCFNNGLLEMCMDKQRKYACKSSLREDKQNVVFVRS